MAKTSSAKTTEKLPGVLTFDRPRVLALVRTAPQLGRIITEADVDQFRKRSIDRAGGILASAAIFGIARARQTTEDREPAQPRGLSAYLTYEDAPKSEVKKRAKYQFGHDEFSGLLTVVKVFASDFDTSLRTAGSVSEAIRGLNTATGRFDIDGQPHPALEAVSSPGSYAERDPRRRAVMDADRLMRYILLEAMTAEPEKAIEQIAS
jgi:hypothetical protein